LEPYIDALTVNIHYNRHLGGYVDKLNAALENLPDLHNRTLEQLIAAAGDPVYPLDDDTRTAILRNAGGVYNHFFYFTQFRPATGQIVVGISPNATAKVNDNFGSWATLKQQFNTSATNLFGSGYVWLVKDPNNKLGLVATENQMTPLGVNLTPLLCIDVWEHAYYLKHYNDRAPYIDAFWHIIDWTKFSQRI
jgi:Fe-Mn family superoxide dismutase